jgi:hypothetical protein
MPKRQLLGDRFNFGNPEAEATLQPQRGLVLPNAAVFTDPVRKQRHGGERSRNVSERE